jgi:hypothetical protein
MFFDRRDTAATSTAWAPPTSMLDESQLGAAPSRNLEQRNDLVVVTPRIDRIDLEAGECIDGAVDAGHHSRQFIEAPASKRSRARCVERSSTGPGPRASSR